MSKKFKSVKFYERIFGKAPQYKGSNTGAYLILKSENAFKSHLFDILPGDDIIGKNVFDDHIDKPNVLYAPHYVIGKDSQNDYAVVQCLPHKICAPNSLGLIDIMSNTVHLCKAYDKTDFDRQIDVLIEFVIGWQEKYWGYYSSNIYTDRDAYDHGLCRQYTEADDYLRLYDMSPRLLRNKIYSRYFEKNG